MGEHGGIPKAHVYSMLASKNARVRDAAFTLLEVSNPKLRRDSKLFVELVRFIWDAIPSYDVYQEFSRRNLFVSHGINGSSKNYYFDKRAKDKAEI